MALGAVLSRSGFIVLSSITLIKPDALAAGGPAQGTAIMPSHRASMGVLAISAMSTTAPPTCRAKPPPMSTIQYCSLTPALSCLPMRWLTPEPSSNISCTDFSWQKRVMSCRVWQCSGANCGDSGSSRLSGTISRAKASRRWCTGLPSIRLGGSVTWAASWGLRPASTAQCPASRVASPAFSSRAQALGRLNSAGRRYSRATEARCPAMPPVSLTMPDARESSGAQRGNARSTTRIPPLGKESMSASLRATNTGPMPTPGLTATPPAASTFSPSGNSDRHLHSPGRAPATSSSPADAPAAPWASASASRFSVAASASRRGRLCSTTIRPVRESSAHSTSCGSA